MEHIKLNIFDKISLWWRFEGRYYHRDFIIGIKNLIKWFPVIWKDRDWDTHYIYEIIGKKLTHQAKYIGDNDRHTMAKRDSERMRLVVKLIKLQQDEFYIMEYMDYHISKHNWLDVEDNPELKELDIELVDENFDEYFKKYPNQYKKVMSGKINRFNIPVEEKDKKVIAMEIAHENQNRSHKLLFKLLDNNIRNWWD